MLAEVQLKRYRFQAGDRIRGRVNGLNTYLTSLRHYHIFQRVALFALRWQGKRYLHFQSQPVMCPLKACQN